MSFDTNWDIEQYKADHESEEHWMLRKKFMEVHKDKFPEDKLVCLAQVFTNIEFMGCKYPDETMELVANLSQDVAKNFRNEKSKRLKRTFVKASDAAEARAKGTILKPAQSVSKPIENDDSLDKNPQQQIQNQLRKRLIESDDEDESRQFIGFNRNTDAIKEKEMKIDLFAGLPFGKFILFDCGDRNAIRLSGQKCGINVQEKESMINGRKKIDTIVGGQLAGSGCSINIKEAKALSFEDAFSKLYENCYSLKPTLNPDRIDISKDNQSVICNLKVTDDIAPQKIDSSNIGFKIMQKLGWSGGGLGSKTQGVQNPVDYLIKNNRRGLGSDDDVVNAEYFREMLSNYIKSEDIRDLYFESSFTKEERAILHHIASEKNLKSASHGKEPNRYLVISKKTITPYRILEEVLIHKNDMYINKYEVHVPDQKAHLFPDHAEVNSG